MRQWIIKIVDSIDMCGGSLASVFASVLLFAMAGALDHWGEALTQLFAPRSVLYRFNAGFILAAYAMGGRSAAKFAWLRFRNGKRYFEPTSNWSDRWLQSLLVFGVVVIAIIGIVTWFVGWNGTGTGTAYGLGAFVGITIYGWSIGRYLEGQTATCPCKLAKLVDLGEVTTVSANSSASQK
ncbi:hypothetical protein [Burkholderia ubonensis]|uniref:hypothetical protein n=1 Tax=Burkholderia ubonensis TaxID=101571 RepID=UPI000A8ED2AF|nr:hypothetical protein [Burkholderia ubonensis]